jgi:hypothetical protein
MRRAVESVVETYLDGMVLADAAATRRAFHPQAHVVGHEAAGLDWLDVDGFVSACAIAGPQPGGRAAHARIISLEIVGDIARVHLEDDYDGARYTDFLTLLFTGGRWQIVNKTFHRHR